MIHETAGNGNQEGQAEQPQNDSGHDAAAVAALICSAPTACRIISGLEFI
ncbi:MAG TPA: hypothetical protein VNQ79_05810 [Blastocatellia bacterium]|nr:hypothetical protein [Blastocatellia bacterium]